MRFPLYRNTSISFFFLDEDDVHAGPGHLVGSLEMCLVQGSNKSNNMRRGVREKGVGVSQYQNSKARCFK